MQRRALTLAVSLAAIVFVRPTGALSPPDQYETFNRDSLLIADFHTKLAWQRDASPDAMVAADATKYCDALTIDGKDDFRVPSYLELSSLVDDDPAFVWDGTARVRRAIDANAFPDTPPNTFWSADSPPDTSDQRWVVDFRSGMGTPGNAGDPRRVRCVRDKP